MTANPFCILRAASTREFISQITRKKLRGVDATYGISFWDLSQALSPTLSQREREFLFLPWEGKLTEFTEA